MRQWMRTTRNRSCGYCGAAIPRGTLVLEVVMHQVPHALVRCAACAGEPVPATPGPAAPTAPVAVARVIPAWSWLRSDTRPVHAPDLVSATTPREWTPYHDGDDG